MDFLISGPGSEYKNFVLVSIDDIPDFDAKGLYLRHKTTGLEVYHFVKDDTENLFSFCFRTAAKNSKGTAHIMEHSTLCGSQKFPLKEPFTTLANQSLNTFLNAMTYPEKTLYPASSVVKSDYYNLMDVYADAVFFPKLTKETFMQEGWRLEYDEKNDKPSIQGVVYNEMKANYSTFSDVATDEFISSIYPDTIKSFDSGGDPLEIPSLTYEEFQNFHKRFYSPSNCLLFLYGDIPTAEQLDFIADNYIPRIEKAYGTLSSLDLQTKVPFVTDEMQKLLKMNRLEKQMEIKVKAPDNGATGCMAGLGWYTGPRNAELVYLNDLLDGNDSSPMSIRLKESKLGDDEATFCGHFGYHLDETIFSYGLCGVKKGNEKKVYEFVQKAIEEIYNEGIKQEDVDSAIMGIDFTLREDNRYYSPRSLTFASKVAGAWALGKAPSLLLSPISDFEKLKEKLRSEPGYSEKLIKKYFIDQKPMLKFVAEPSKQYFDERNKREKELVQMVEKGGVREEYKKELEALHQYQQKEETEEEIKCIPHLNLSQLKDIKLNYIKTEYETVKGADGNDIPVVVSKEQTNGIIYVEICFPIDNLSPENFVDFPLFMASLSNLGWNGKKWDKCTAELACVLGDLNVKSLLGTVPDSEETLKTLEKYPDKNVAGRFWINFSGKFLAEKADKSLELISEMLTTMSFDDKKHFETILTEYTADKKQNFAGSGNYYIQRRGYSKASKNQAASELLWGITQFMYARKLTKRAVPALLEKYKDLYKEILSQGAVIHITTDEKSYPEIMKKLPAFVVKTGLTKLKPSKNYKQEDYAKYFYKPKNYDEKKNREVIQVPTQSGFSSMFFPCSTWLTKAAAAEEVLGNYLSGHQLWEKIRMTGGAYGSYGGNDSVECLFSITSYRDPNPVKSLETFLDALKELSEKQFTEEEVERSILTCYSGYITPDSAVNRGTRGFNRYLYGNNWQIMQKTIDLILQVTPQDMHEAAVRLYKNAMENRREFIFCDNSIKSYGNILKIPL